jgi:hypothetical protein
MQYKIPKFINSLHAAGHQPNEICTGCRPTGCNFGRHPGVTWLPAGHLPVSIYHSVDRQLEANFAEISG